VLQLGVIKTKSVFHAIIICLFLCNINSSVANKTAKSQNKFLGDLLLSFSQEKQNKNHSVKDVFKFGFLKGTRGTKGTLETLLTINTIHKKLKNKREPLQKFH
jgi:hypothetical protein